MRAVRVGDPGLELVERDPRALGSGELRVSVIASPITGLDRDVARVWLEEKRRQAAEQGRPIRGSERVLHVPRWIPERSEPPIEPWGGVFPIPRACDGRSPPSSRPVRYAIS